jgi:type I restriction enzyme M protein
MSNGFYKPQPLRKLTNIRVDIVILENENKGLLEKIIGGIGLT